MGDIRTSSIGGTPFGDTASRPSSPQVGQTYYNGQLGYLEIYTVSGWIPATGANDFSLNITGPYTEVTFSQTYSSGSYSIVSFLNDATIDVYAFATDDTSAGYTNTKAFTAIQRFNKMVIIGGSTGDVLQFSYKTTYATSLSTASTSAGPYITSITPSGMPNQNDTITITGGNFATNVAVAFTGTGYSSTAPKSIVRSSSTQLIVTRPDNFPPSGAPYTVTVTNPSVANQPTGSAAHIYSGITAGAVPIWVTSASQTIPNGMALGVVATEADGASTVTYSLVSGSVPTGTTLKSNGTFSGVPNVNGTYNFTIRATDSGGNYVDRAFTFTVAGSSTSDATYYYSAITSNSTISLGDSLIADIVAVGGGGAATSYSGGGGGGEVIYIPSKTISAGSYPITIGAGGAGNNGNGYQSAQQGSSTTCFGETVKPGGGAKSSDDTPPTSSVTDRGPLTSVANGGGGSSRSAGYGGTTGTSVGSGITRYGGRYGGNNIGGGSAPTNNGNYTGGGGAGAGADGDNGQNDSYTAQGNVKGGNGGAGVQVLGYYWGGGGGGGIYYQSVGTPKAGNGGIGGGGAGGSTANSSTGGGSAYNSGGNNSGDNGGHGGANTGGGGGAGRGETAGMGGNGGSGIVYIRFTKSQVA